MRTSVLIPLVAALSSASIFSACAPDSADSENARGEGATSSRAGARTTPAGMGGAEGGGSGGQSGGQVASGGLGAKAGAGGGVNPPRAPVLGPAELDADELDAPSDGGTLTFQNLGEPGFYPSRREPGTAPCDVYSSGSCCMTRHELKDDKLTPWSEELVMTLRGPMQLKQVVVYTADESGLTWSVQSAWDSTRASDAFGIAFDGEATKGAKLAGTIGSECIVDVMTDQAFPCGPGSVPYCPAGGTKNYGWRGSKLFVMTVRMPMADGDELDRGTACGTGTSNGWYNAPWIGFSLGELTREGKFGDCNCYGRTPQEWYAGDGCGQINAFEVVNDNNDFQNFDVFSSNIFAYYGSVGEGPCGKGCDVAGVGPADLIDKTTSQLAVRGGVTTFGGASAHVAFRRPTRGYRYVLALFDVQTRQLQLAIIHPNKVPTAAAGLLPALPLSLGRVTIDALLEMRLPG